MRKIRVLLLMLMTVCLVGCSTPEPTDEGTTEPSRGIDHFFDSYEELEKWFRPDEAGKIPATEDLNQYGKQYDNLINSMIQGEIQVVKGYFGEEEIPLRNKEGYANISISSEDMYYRPWISYNFLVANRDCIICITYLNEDEINYTKEHTIDEVVKYIWPYEINLDDWRYSSTKSVSVESWQLSDRKVSALCIESDMPRSKKIFIYDNMYILLSVEPELFDEDIWKTFSLRAE